MYRRSLPWLPVVLLIAVFAACSGTEEPAAESAAEPTVYTVRGMLARVEDDGMTMTVRHEDIPGYMASMTMPFKVGDASLLEGLEYGDKIEFELTVDDDGMSVHSITELPAETVLAFE